jgi:hypothetical protein
MNKVDPNPPNRAGLARLHDSFQERTHIEAMYKAVRALIDDHGWKEIMYAPKDGTPFEVIEPYSTGIFRGRWLGKNNDLLFVEDAHDLWPSKACLFRLCSQSSGDSKHG